MDKEEDDKKTYANNKKEEAGLKTYKDWEEKYFSDGQTDDSLLMILHLQTVAGYRS